MDWRSHLFTPQSVRLLWMSDQPVAEPSAWQHTTLTGERHPCLPAAFEPAIPASERPQTHALDRAATGTAGLVICLGLIQGFLPVLYFGFLLSVSFHKCHVPIFFYALFLSERETKEVWELFKKSSGLSEIGEHWLEKYFDLVFIFMGPCIVNRI